ncbi:hypothetical protein [Mycoplasmopsis sturni]|nr:hypothetical protein [Mycoplasmopsis sturni]
MKIDYELVKQIQKESSLILHGSYSYPLYFKNYQLESNDIDFISNSEKMI